MSTNNKNSKKGKKNGKQGQRRRNVQARSARQVYSGDGGVLQKHWEMLVDPCTSTLTESAYRGAAGIPSRFTRTATVLSGSDTCYMYIGNPAGLSYANVAAVTSVAPVTPVFAYGMAGKAFITANSAAFRVVSSCLTVEYIGTELNRSGKLYTGVLPAQTIAGGVATSIDKVKTLLTSSCRTPDYELESLWFPGVGNENYCDINTSADMFNDDKNVTVFIAENCPAGVQIQVRETIIVEWLPKPDMGFTAAKPAGGSNPPAAMERLHNAASHNPIFAGFKEGARAAGSYYARQIGSGIVDLAAGVGRSAVRGAMRAAPLLLTM